MENSQKIEAYFNNELSSADEQQLIKELESNPELKQDFEFQQDIVEGLKSYRKEQLIARLNEVKIISTTQHLVVKVISSVAVVAVVGLGAYFFYYTNNNESRLLSEAAKTSISDPGIDDPQLLIEDVPEQEPINETQQDLIVENKEVDVKQTPQPAVPKENIISEKTPEVTMPDIVDPFETEVAEDNVEEDLSVPANTTTTELNLRSKLDVEIKMKRKYNFHYQLIEQKLVLYGDFEDEPFEILEINKDNGGIDLYLYYKDNFYGIDQGSKKIEPLKEIADPVLIQRLQALR